MWEWVTFTHFLFRQVHPALKVDFGNTFYDFASTAIASAYGKTAITKVFASMTIASVYGNRAIALRMAKGDALRYMSATGALHTLATTPDYGTYADT